MVYLVMIIAFDTLLFGHRGDVEVLKCKDCNESIIQYFHQNSWGGTPQMTAGIGELYLGGLLYKTSIDTTFFAEYQFLKDIDSLYNLPKHLDSMDLVFIWKGQNLVLTSKESSEFKCFVLKEK